jgi:integration host factor subunit alpha
MPKTSKAVTRVELYEAVYQKVGLSRTESSAFVELVLTEITDCLEKGETVKLSSFGSFMVREKGGRLGRNPRHRGADLSATRGGVQALSYYETADQQPATR